MTSDAHRDDVGIPDMGGIALVRGCYVWDPDTALRDACEEGCYAGMEAEAVPCTPFGAIPAKWTYGDTDGPGRAVNLIINVI